MNVSAFIVLLKCLAVLLPLMTVLGLLFYFKDVFRWRRALNVELDKLTWEKENCLPQTRNAFNTVDHHCRRLLRIGTLDKPFEAGLTDFIVSIAGCFSPASENPAFDVTPARILRSIDLSLTRFDQIVTRPGFDILSNLAVKDIRYLTDIFMTLTKPDSSGSPSISSLFYLVRHIRPLFLIRYLAVDFHLYLGQLAVNAYGGNSSCVVDDPEEAIEDTLEELSRIHPSHDRGYHPEIIRIKESLVGMPGVLWNDPSLSRWKQAVLDSAGIIAAHYFPHSKFPLEEARIGPLVLRFRMFLSTLGKGDDDSMTGKIFNIRLETLFQARTLSQVLIPQKLRSILVRTQKTYGWLKWPLNVYLMTSKGVFWKIAADAGWFAGRKAILVLMFGRSFDKAVHELNEVYRLSSE